MVAIHPHAAARLELRGATAEEVVETVELGEKFPAKFDRTGFHRTFQGHYLWRAKAFDTKRVEAYAVFENHEWLVITVIVKFGRAS